MVKGLLLEMLNSRAFDVLDSIGIGAEIKNIGKT